jgi:hypothetical protein
MKLKPSILATLAIVLGCLFFTSCILLPGKPDSIELTSTSIALTPSQIPSTPTPMQPLAVLVVPQGADQVLASELEATLERLSASNGIGFQTRTVLVPSELTTDIKIVAAIPPDPGLATLSQSAPGTQFVAIGINGITAGDNLSLIRYRSYDAESLAFIAGYIAGVVTADWRAGILLPDDQTSAATLLQAFSNGLHFWCGLCMPVYAPFNTYPQSAQIINPADPVTTLATVDTLSNMAVQTFYVPPELSTNDLMDYIAQKQGLIIGASQPSATAASRWVVSLRSASPAVTLESLWPALIAGNGGQTLTVSLDLADTEAGFLNASRQRVVRGMMMELESGLISPSLIPE